MAKEQASVEPWLRGPIPNTNPLIAPPLYCFDQVREDLALHTEGLTPEQIWARPYGLGPLGFHLRHIAGSVDRLATYLDGRELSPAQMADIQHQMDPGASREELLAEIDDSLRRAEEIIRRMDLSKLDEPRYIGRKRLPSTVIGLMTHIAEHTQRHVGQAISAAKLARAAG